MSGIHIIAEAGTNHNGNKQTAKELVEVAKEAGADSVKFQLIYPEGLYLPEFYRDGGYEQNEVFEKRKRWSLSDEDYREIFQYSQSLSLPVSASLFDLRGAVFLDSLDVPYFKIASCDLNNLPLLERIAEFGRRIVISTGMASLSEIEDALATLNRAGCKDTVIMHCVSVYPAKVQQMNLSFIRVLQQAFGCPVGFSDHSESSVAAAAAVAMGVTWIEKHFTTSRSQDGFDHAYAMEPEMLRAYIEDIRSVEAACARPENKLGSDEANVKQRARRSLYAARDIQPGERISINDILIVRPEGPLQPKDAYSVSGCQARRPICRYQAFDWSLLERS